jgi:hypothetical protein
MDNFYTYLWLREDGTPYYVGKGVNRRVLRRHRVGKPPSLDRILVQEFLSETDALAAETFLISYYGREDLGLGCLLNLTDGGESGPRGYKASAETRRKMSLAHKGCVGFWLGKTRSAKTRAKQSIAAQGKKKSEETRKRMSAAQMGNTHNLGHTRSTETRQKQSDAMKGNHNKLGWRKVKLCPNLM